MDHEREREPQSSPEPEQRLEIQSLPADSRPRERLASLGAQALAQSELLSLVIGIGHGEQDALSLSRAMLAHFGGLERLNRASTTELQAIKGIGQVKALQIQAAMELGRRLMTPSNEERPAITTPAEAA